MVGEVPVRRHIDLRQTLEVRKIRKVRVVRVVKVVGGVGKICLLRGLPGILLSHLPRLARRPPGPATVPVRRRPDRSRATTGQ